MQGFIRSVLLGTMCFCTYSLYVYVHHVMSSLPLVTSCTMLWDVRFSTATQQRVRNYISQMGLFNSLPASAEIMMLKAMIPTIGACTLSLRPSGELIVELKSINPLAVINNDHIMAEDGTFFEATSFDSCFLKNLPHVVCELDVFSSTKSEHVDSCKAYIEHMPWHITDDYTCSWSCSTVNTLVAKRYPKIMLVCSNEHMPDEKIIKGHIKISEHLVSQGLLRDTCKEWVVDARFRDQMVVYARGKGRDYGRDIFG